MSTQQAFELTVQEAADLAGKTPATIRHAVKRGALPLLRTEKRNEGGRDRWYIHINDLRALYPRNKRGPGKKATFRPTNQPQETGNDSD